MRPIGKTYLIKCPDEDPISLEDRIYVINNVDKQKDGHWKGVVAAYGNGFTDEEKKNLLPIGTPVVMNYTVKAEMKLIIKNIVYYVRKEEDIVGVIEE